jgi:hypothetical protein
MDGLEVVVTAGGRCVSWFGRCVSWSATAGARLVVLVVLVVLSTEGLPASGLAAIDGRPAIIDCRLVSVVGVST